MNSRQVLGIMGGVLLVLGPFLPFVSSPVVGDITWFEGEKAGGIIMAILGIGSIFLAVKGKLRSLWFTGGAALAMLVYAYYDFHSALEATKQDVETKLAGNPLGGLAVIATESIELKWALPVAFLGAVLVIAAAALKPQLRSQATAAT